MRTKKSFVKWKLIILLNLFYCGLAQSQISVELNWVGAKPFGTFSENINRDGFFGVNFGVFYKLKKYDYLNVGLQFTHLPYDASSYSDLKYQDNLYIRQMYKSKVGMQSFIGVIRAQLYKESKLINPYIDGLVGFNRFYGVTRADDAFFTGDTDGNGKINSLDGEINPADLGINTSIILPKSTIKYDLRSISTTIGLGIGMDIKLIKSLKFDIRAAYMQGIQTTYYNYGSEDIVTNSIDNFKLVQSAIPVFLLTSGLTYTF